MGLVFRDRDELPLSNNLTQDIYDALDNSGFLIVVCTPETPKSLWVRREIQHFIQVHGRDRVLTVLAAGTVETSVPPEITTRYAEDGVTVLERFEPLCAYLTDVTPRKVLKNLEKEALRLYAAILGCPFDALKQRHKRYRMQRLAAALGMAALLAVAFIGMLINRNAEISNKNQQISDQNMQLEAQLAQIRQLARESQLQESESLTLLSRMQFAEGNCMSALNSALNALPSDDPERPYYAAAEGALADALFVYREPEFRVTSAYDAPGYTPHIAFSDSGRYAILATNDYLIQLDLATSEEVWRVVCPTSYLATYIHISQDQEIFLLKDPSDIYVYSLATGAQLGSIPIHGQNAEFIGISPDAGTIALRLDADGSIVLYDAASAEETWRISMDNWVCRGEFSADSNSLLLYESTDDTDDASVVFVVDCAAGQVFKETVPGDVSGCAALPDGDFALLSSAADGETVYNALYRTSRNEKTIRKISDGITLNEIPYKLLATDEWIYCVGEQYLQILSLADGALLEETLLEGEHIRNGFGTTAFLDIRERLVIARDEGIYLYYPTDHYNSQTSLSSRKYDGSIYWNRVQVFAGASAVEEVYHNANSRSALALKMAGTSLLRFLHICGDENGVETDAAAGSGTDSQSKLYPDFQDGILTLKTFQPQTAVSVECPYESIEDDSYGHRTFGERGPMAYSTGLAELYCGQNGIVIVCYYEGGYEDRGLYDWDTPEAYAIYSLTQDQWNWFEDEALSDPFIGLFFPESGTCFAIACGENVLKIYDFASNAITLEMELPLTYLSGVRFSSDARYALAFDSVDYKTVLIDISSGDLLTVFDFIPEIYDNNFYVGVAGSRLYIEEVSADGIDSYGVIIDMETGEALAKIPDMEYYDPEMNAVVCRRKDGTLLAYPAYTTQDLIDMAKETLE